jgi:hypothetical protein
MEGGMFNTLVIPDLSFAFASGLKEVNGCNIAGGVVGSAGGSVIVGGVVGASVCLTGFLSTSTKSFIIIYRIIVRKINRNILFN